MNGSNAWGSLAPFGDILALFKWNIYKKIRKITRFTKLRIIAVQVMKSKRFQMTLNGITLCSNIYTNIYLKELSFVTLESVVCNNFKRINSSLATLESAV